MLKLAGVRDFATPPGNRYPQSAIRSTESVTPQLGGDHMTKEPDVLGKFVPHSEGLLLPLTTSPAMYPSCMSFTRQQQPATHRPPFPQTASAQVLAQLFGREVSARTAIVGRPKWRTQWALNVLFLDIL